MGETDNEFPNLNLEEILRRQLASFAISSEIGRVVASATSLPAVVQTMGLGFQEMLGFKRTALFSIDPELFQLKAMGGVGLESQDLEKVRFGLEFIAGEYADAIFRNRHVIVDLVPEDDPFSTLGSTQYAVFPMVGRITGNCWETRKCGCNACPCFEQPGTICWATEGSALFTSTRSEDDKRKACVKCPQFKCIGVLWLDLTGRQMITGDDVSVITSIMLQAGLVIENFQMYDILQDKNGLLSQTNDALEGANRRIRKDLERDKEIQSKLLPAKFPENLRGVAAHYAAHIEIGGDYYDCFEVSENRLDVVIADVSGHGVSAALVMSMFKTMLKQLAPVSKSPSETLRRINEIFMRDVNTDMFVTVFYAIWERDTHVLRWTNAGHPPILLLDQTSGQVTELKSRGLFLGMFDEIKCTDMETSILNDQRLLLYTDGIIEAENSTATQFGLDRLASLLSISRRETANEVINNLLEDLAAHVGSTPIADDITLLCCDL